MARSMSRPPRWRPQHAQELTRLSALRLLDQAAEAAAANETRQQRRLQRHRERLKELREEAAAKAEGRPWPPPGGTPKRTTNGVSKIHSNISSSSGRYQLVACMFANQAAKAEVPPSGTPKHTSNGGYVWISSAPPVLYVLSIECDCRGSGQHTSLPSACGCENGMLAEHLPAATEDDSASDDDDKGVRNANGGAPLPPRPAKPAGPPVFELPPLPEMDISDAEKMELVRLLRTTSHSHMCPWECRILRLPCAAQL